MKRPNLDAIEARAKAALPGPWIWNEAERGEPYSDLCAGDNPHWEVAKIYPRDGFLHMADTDAAFIIHSRQDIPDLIAYVRHLEALIKPSKDALAVLKEVGKAVHIDWKDDVYGEGYGADAAEDLERALAAIEEK